MHAECRWTEDPAYFPADRYRSSATSPATSCCALGLLIWPEAGRVRRQIKAATMSDTLRTLSLTGTRSEVITPADAAGHRRLQQPELPLI